MLDEGLKFRSQGMFLVFLDLVQQFRRRMHQAVQHQLVSPQDIEQQRQLALHFAADHIKRVAVVQEPVHRGNDFVQQTLMTTFFGKACHYVAHQWRNICPRQLRRHPFGSKAHQPFFIYRFQQLWNEPDNETRQRVSPRR